MFGFIHVTRMKLTKARKARILSIISSNCSWKLIQLLGKHGSVGGW